VPTSDRIDELKKRYDENPRRFFASLANEYRKAGDLDQAISICQAHLAEQPSNMNGHVVYGQALFEAGRYDEAKTTFEAALTLDPENLIALRHLGDIACTNGANDNAREWYERVLDADPRNEEIIALLAHLAAAANTATADASTATEASVPPRESYGDFKPPQVVTPFSTTPVSELTPVVPLDAVKTVEVPAVSVPPAAPRASLGLMDLTFDFETPSEPSFPASEPPAHTEPVAHADAVLDMEFPAFEEVQLGAPSESIPAVSETDGDLLLNPFADPEPVEELSVPVESAQPEPPAEPFVTETMAELYLQQGFMAEALEVYRQLSVAYPDDEKLKARVRGLERGDSSSISLDIIPEAEPGHASASADGVVHDLMPERAPDPAPEPRSVLLTVRSYFAGLAARRAVQGSSRAHTTPQTPAPRISSPHVAAPLPAGDGMLSFDEMFAGHEISANDEQVALAFAQVAGAVEMGAASVKGKPTAPAESELSLDSVFHKADTRATAPVARQSQTLRFDQFFTPAGGEPDVASAPSLSAPAGEPGSPAELQQFQSWLTGLKKP
jgi:tetratricopeptide (TPR) repeat protein